MIINNNIYQNSKLIYSKQSYSPCFGEKTNESTETKSDNFSSSYLEFCKKWFAPRDGYSKLRRLPPGLLLIMTFAVILAGAITLFRKHKILGFK